MQKKDAENQKMIYQKPFGHFFGIFVLFDQMALGPFCNSVDPEAQPELETQFSRTQEKATQVDQLRTKTVVCGFNTS